MADTNLVIVRRLLLVEVCPRCLGCHEDLAFSRLTRPSGGWAWWASCPTTLEPILLRLHEESTPAEREADPAYPIDLGTHP